MKLRLIKTEKEYEAALKEIEPYFDEEPKAGSEAADRFDMLALLIEDYERRQWPIKPADPIDVIEFKMQSAGLSQSDLAELLGSRARASEILRRKRHLSLPMIRKLVAEWHLPAETLIGPYRLAGTANSHKRRHAA
jgi:HTH-type transcriptional regulator/antitoxin HigA